MEIGRDVTEAESSQLIIEEIDHLVFRFPNNEENNSYRNIILDLIFM